MTNEEQELMRKIEQLRNENNKLSLILVGLIKQYSQDGQTIIIKGGVPDVSPKPPRIHSEINSEGDWYIRLDYGTS